MRLIMLAVAATVFISAPMAASVKAEETTTIIKKDHDMDRDRGIVIKKEEPREEKKVIIRKEGGGS